MKIYDEDGFCGQGPASPLMTDFFLPRMGCFLTFWQTAQYCPSTASWALTGIGPPCIKEAVPSF